MSSSPARTLFRKVGFPTSRDLVSSAGGHGCTRTARRVRHIVQVAFLALFSACTQASPSSKAPIEQAVVTPSAAGKKIARPFAGQIVAIGDLHGDLEASLKVLKLAGLVNDAGHWSGGRTVFVQTGDTTDRGPDSKGVIELLMRLSVEAEDAGGRVVALLGNHEIMNLTGDWRYVHPGDVAAFGSPEQRRAALAPDGELGRWLRQRDVVAKVGDTVFVHGGVSPAWAERGIDAINGAARVAIDAEPRARVLGSEGPLWLRDYLQAPPSIACPMLADALASLGAARMVVGHTTQRTGRVATRCEGALLGIDTGISAHYGGNLSAIRIEAGNALAVYRTEVEDLPDPTVAPTSHTP